eukprot:jgi/Picre1/33452/NNA_008776.t1
MARLNHYPHQSTDGKDYDGFGLGFPKNEETKHDSILVFVDRLSKMVRTVPIQKEGLSTKRIVEAFIDTIFKLHGMPKRIITDRASTFTGEFYHAMMDVFGTKLSHTTAFHPQSDGQTERANRSIIDMLRAYCANNIQDWEKYLPLVEFALNSAVSTSTQTTPFFLNELWKTSSIPICKRIHN